MHIGLPAHALQFTTQGLTTNKPVAAGDGKPRAERSGSEQLCFAHVFGLAWSKAHEHLLPESRAMAILRHEGIEDAGEARRIIAEWAAGRPKLRLRCHSRARLGLP
jgi:hypothetical protein